MTVRPAGSKASASTAIPIMPEGLERGPLGVCADLWVAQLWVQDVASVADGSCAAEQKLYPYGLMVMQLKALMNKLVMQQCNHGRITETPATSPAAIIALSFEWIVQIGWDIRMEFGCAPSATPPAACTESSPNLRLSR